LLSRKVIYGNARISGFESKIGPGGRAQAINGIFDDNVFGATAFK